VLYGLVRKHLATFLAHTEATYSAPLPRYVVDTFERYLACGDFSRGFVRCHRDACAHDVLVPFNCKGRGLCPSCNARRMSNEAACLTDHVLPNARLRQWVLSRPFELRGLAATKPDVLTALGRIFAEEIARVTKRLANVTGAETGAISFPLGHFLCCLRRRRLDRHVALPQALPPLSLLLPRTARRRPGDDLPRCVRARGHRTPFLPRRPVGGRTRADDPVASMRRTLPRRGARGTFPARRLAVAVVLLRSAPPCAHDRFSRRDRGGFIQSLATPPRRRALRDVVARGLGRPDAAHIRI
jgi:hypothetical protein